VDAELLGTVRRRIGAKIPLVVTLDLHANVTRDLVAFADVLVPYHTMPHVDIFRTGQRGAAVLRRLLVQGAQPVTAFQKIPAVVPAERSSTEMESGPAADLKRKLVALEARDGVLSCGIFPVQPWLDVPQLGSAVIVTTDNDAALAGTACAELAGEFWRRRDEYVPELYPIAEAVRKAHAECPDGLIVLSDPADATTSGAPGDSVWILQELLQYAWPRPALATIVAPGIVQQAAAARGTDAVHFSLGGVRDYRFGMSIEVDAIVERLFEARFILSGHIGTALAIDMGPSAVLKMGEVYLVVTSRTGPHFAPELFQAAGRDPFGAAVLVAKSPCGFRAAYESRAKAIYSVRAPGCAPPDFWNYSYRHIRRPLWPWDDIRVWQPAPQLISPAHQP
jgi:microcystin degradation protein MlrC